MFVGEFFNGMGGKRLFAAGAKAARPPPESGRSVRNLCLHLLGVAYCCLRDVAGARYSSVLGRREEKSAEPSRQQDRTAHCLAWVRLGFLLVNQRIRQLREFQLPDRNSFIHLFYSLPNLEHKLRFNENEEIYNS